ncbi:MAG: hypothetical protein ACI8PB_001084 [Desulforhopalus sp.]|jgi:hypothetical protein
MKEIYQKLGVEVYINQPFRRYDAVIYFRGMQNRDYLNIRLLRLICRKIYWDTVVDYFDVHEACDEKQVKSSRRIARFVDGVICSTSIIAESARTYNSNVIVMNDPIDVGHFSIFKKSINWKQPTFIWSGVAHKSEYLDCFADLLSEKTTLIMEKELPRKFKYRFLKWTYEKFPNDVVKGDIAFLPRLVNTPYNKGHSCFKALPFAVAGIPILANRLPSYVEMSKHYDAICFLEDYTDVSQALLELEKRSRDTQKVRDIYSCETIGRKFIDQLYRQS